jgi:outer membrane protein
MAKPITDAFYGEPLDEREGRRLGLLFWLVAVLVVTSLGGITRIHANESVDQNSADRITLNDAVYLALEHNHSLRAAEHAHRAASWAHRQAKAQFLPTISLESSYTRLDDETVSRANAIGRQITMYFPDSTGALQPVTIEIPQTVFRDGYQTSITGQLLLLNPAIWNGVSLTGVSKDLAADELQAALRTTTHQTVRAFLELLKLHSLVRIQEQHVVQAQRNTEQAERLFHVGRYSEADVLRWRVEESRQQGFLTDTRRALRVATLTLENLIGAAPEASVVPDSILSGGLLNEVNRFRAMDDAEWDLFNDVALDDIVSGNPDLRLLEDTNRLSKLEHRQSITAFLPSITVAGSYGWQNNDSPELDGDKAWAVSAALSVPIFTSFGNYSGYQTTKHKVLQIQESVQDSYRAILLNAEASRTALRSSTAQLSLAETSLRSARRGFEIQERNFALGRLGNLEWIDANLSLRAAEQEYTSSYYSVLLAVVDYYYITGEILALLEE